MGWDGMEASIYIDSVLTRTYTPLLRGVVCCRGQLGLCHGSMMLCLIQQRHDVLWHALLHGMSKCSAPRMQARSICR